MTEAKGKKDATGRTVTIVVLVIIIILLWWWLRRPKNVRNEIMKYGDVVLDGPRNSNYNVPGLNMPEGPWDWIHATDLGFMPGLPMRKRQTLPLSFDPIMLPVLVYVRDEVPALPTLGGMPPAPEFDFEPWTAPPLPKWWYAQGYNTNFTPVTYVMTEDNSIGVLGKHAIIMPGFNPTNRKYTKYPMQTDIDKPTGQIIMLNGQRYQHDASKDNMIAMPVIINNSFGAG